MSLYLFTNQEFSLAVCRDPRAATLPAGEWRLVKEVQETEIDPAIVARIETEGHWFYRPGRASQARPAESEI
ncbi:hypothetical protein [Alsobacter metallidurans]|nr:hypothetical protein [Alsobacter metallidurans]